MEKCIFNKDNGGMGYITVDVEDFEVDELWRKWNPIEDEDSTEIEIKDIWDKKQRAAGEMRKNKKKILEGVYCTVYEKYSLLINRRDGKVYHFNNRLYQLEVEGQDIYLRKISTYERECVYQNGVFYPTKGNWLKEGSEKLSKNGCRGIKIYSDLYGIIKIKNHQIVAAMFIGQEAVELAMDENGEFHINHRNLDNTDNRPENLEIVTRDENTEHRVILKRFIGERLAGILKKMGVTNYLIINTDKQLASAFATKWV